MKVRSTTTCSDCSHSAHEPSECDKCNCGESAIVHMTGYAVPTTRFAIVNGKPFFTKSTAYINRKGGQE